MTTFNNQSAFVWIWLPDATQPVVAGKLEKKNHRHDFFYGQSYLRNQQAIALSERELPLIGNKRFSSHQEIHGVIRDSLPDAWGQRILQHYYPDRVLSPLDMLLLSGADRIGALHFQHTSEHYIAQPAENPVSLTQLMQAAELFEHGQPLPTELDIALNRGTSIGGARPKAMIDADNKKFIAKFSSTTDIFPVVQAEYAAMWLANKIGITTATVQLTHVKGKFVLLVERFDRNNTINGWARKFMISALTLLGLSEMEGRYASYIDLADWIRKQGNSPVTQLHALFKRMVFNIMIGNTDDHAKNHAFFWDGKTYELTPAYDICPYPRMGQEATQAMQVGIKGAYSQLSNALSAAASFHLTDTHAQQIIDEMVAQVKEYWPLACKEAQLTSSQQKLLTNTAVLNPFIFQ